MDIQNNKPLCRYIILDVDCNQKIVCNIPKKLHQCNITLHYEFISVIHSLIPQTLVCVRELYIA